MNEYLRHIRTVLEETLHPESLVIEDESSRHAGHTGAGGHGGGHYIVHIVAACFDGKTRIERHRMVHAALGNAFKNDIHALSVKVQTPEEAGVRKSD